MRLLSRRTLSRNLATFIALYTSKCHVRHVSRLRHLVMYATEYHAQMVPGEFRAVYLHVPVFVDHHYPCGLASNLPPARISPSQWSSPRSISPLTTWPLRYPYAHCARACTTSRVKSALSRADEALFALGCHTALFTT